MTLQEQLRAPARAGVIICREAADRIDALERENAALRKACDIARTMLRTGLPEYDARDVLEILDAAMAQR